MYIKVQKLSGGERLLLNVSKKSTIAEIRQLILKNWEIDPNKQKLFYKGKLLVDEHTLMEYNVQLNDVIQLMVSEKNLENDTESENSEEKLEEEEEVKFAAVDSKYYEIGDLIDYCDEMAHWSEGKIVEIVRKETEQVEEDEKNLIFKVSLANDEDHLPLEISFANLRPRSYFKFNLKDLGPGMIVLANYNIEEPGKLGYWYDCKIKTTYTKSLVGTIFAGVERTPMPNTVIKNCDEFWRIEKPKLKKKRKNNQNNDKTNGKNNKLDKKVNKNSDKNGENETENDENNGDDEKMDCENYTKNDVKMDENGKNKVENDGNNEENDVKMDEDGENIEENNENHEEIVEDEEEDKIEYPRELRKVPYYCAKCKDDKKKKCKECGCNVCAGKNSLSELILCDECDHGYHIFCLSPKLENVPKGDWYCPDCKRDENEIVKAGDKLKASKKKAKMPSMKKEGAGSSRDWGRGMACVGRTKECTLVPIHHVGSVPGVEVGTTWKFRSQVSEAGIHRLIVAGIHGRENDCAYSLALSGGYEDDIDNGSEFYYTGSGGRDLTGNKRCAEQSFDQKLTLLNKALALNCNVKFNAKEGAQAEDWRGGRPVRVVRNYKLGKHSKFAPKEGNRYDGLYKVVKYYPQKGKSGFVVWRYLLRRDDPVPAPWEKNGKEYDIIYPEGYLEAQATKEKEKLDKKQKRNTNKDQKGSKKDRSGSEKDQSGSEKDQSSPEKGRKNTKNGKKRPLNDSTNSSPFAKKTKADGYQLEKDLEEKIENDALNEKLWAECKGALNQEKSKFVAKVEDVFTCICCQELVCNPITTGCKHNFCKSCVKRSFAAKITTCPCCRADLGDFDALLANHQLSLVLNSIFPGYEAGR